MMLGMAKVVFSILLSGMTAIGRAWNPGGVAMVLHLGGKFLTFGLAERTKRLLSDWMLGTVNIDSDWLPGGCDLNYGRSMSRGESRRKLLTKIKKVTFLENTVCNKKLHEKNIITGDYRSQEEFFLVSFLSLGV
ncbi:hypothetical protein TNCV_2530971 [Trichonephila clavipes]|nr:hypothetical protein TNCV_2530971 [Trichonephila clavipes]